MRDRADPSETPNILRFPIDRIHGMCRSCGTTEYTILELNLHEGQRWTCYRCWEYQRAKVR